MLNDSSNDDVDSRACRSWDNMTSAARMRTRGRQDTNASSLSLAAVGDSAGGAIGLSCTLSNR